MSDETEMRLMRAALRNAQLGRAQPDRAFASLYFGASILLWIAAELTAVAKFVVKFPFVCASVLFRLLRMAAISPRLTWHVVKIHWRYGFGITARAEVIRMMKQLDVRSR